MASTATTSTATQTIGTNGLPCVKVSHSSGANATVYLFGATLTSWQTAAGNEVLFLSSKAQFDGTTPIRGGIPLVFPQFGGGKLPSHGFARRSVWELDEVGDGTATFSLKPTDAIKAMWDHAFTLHYTVTLGADTLTTTLKATNTADDSSFDFQALLHTYFCAGPDGVAGLSVDGLGKETEYIDKLTSGSDGTFAVVKETSDAVKFSAETDRIYKCVAGDVSVTGVSTKGGVVTVARGSSIDGKALDSDVVVWNPWIDKAKRMADFGDEEYKTMCCVEPGNVSGWLSLAPGQCYTLSQTLTASL